MVFPILNIALPSALGITPTLASISLNWSGFLPSVLVISSYPCTMNPNIFHFLCQSFFVGVGFDVFYRFSRLYLVKRLSLYRGKPVLPDHYPAFCLVLYQGDHASLFPYYSRYFRGVYPEH